MTNKIGIVAMAVAITALLSVIVHPGGKEPPPPLREPAFERVTQTRTLRCAYITRPRHFMIDPATKELSGIDHDVMEAAAKALRLKIEWVEETGYGDFPQQLASGKEDALCTTVWSSSARAERVLMTTPILYTALYVYVRDGDTRFDGDLTKLNNENVTLAVIDGATMKMIADTTFPKAKQFAATGMSGDGLVMLNIATNKADAGFFDEPMVNDFNAHSKEQRLRRIPDMPPVRTYPEAFSVAVGEWRLREMLDVALNELHNNGTLERILRQYESTPGELTRLALPYAPRTAP